MMGMTIPKLETEIQWSSLLSHLGTKVVSNDYSQDYITFDIDMYRFIHRVSSNLVTIHFRRFTSLHLEDSTTVKVGKKLINKMAKF